jgi:lipoyl(octanoyl) transferase
LKRGAGIAKAFRRLKPKSGALFPAFSADHLHRDAFAKYLDRGGAHLAAIGLDRDWRGRVATERDDRSALKPADFRQWKLRLANDELYLDLDLSEICHQMSDPEPLAAAKTAEAPSHLPVRGGLNGAFLVPGLVAEWAASAALQPYEAAVAAMEARAEAIAAGHAPELVWLLEHPPLYTAGTSAKASDLLDARFPVHRSARGGQLTYHGPGQRVAYLMLDLSRRRRDVRGFVGAVEAWLIDALAAFNVRGETRADRVGVWVDRTAPGAPHREDKIAAIGIRIRRWVSFHGIALNVEPDLSHFSGIVPCGVSAPGFGVTSLVDLGLPVTMDDADAALEAAFHRQFGPTRRAAPPI